MLTSLLIATLLAVAPCPCEKHTPSAKPVVKQRFVKRYDSRPFLYGPTRYIIKTETKVIPCERSSWVGGFSQWNRGNEALGGGEIGSRINQVGVRVAVSGNDHLTQVNGDILLFPGVGCKYAEMYVGGGAAGQIGCTESVRVRRIREKCKPPITEVTTRNDCDRSFAPSVILGVQGKGRLMPYAEGRATYERATGAAVGLRYRY